MRRRPSPSTTSRNWPSCRKARVQWEVRRRLTRQTSHWGTSRSANSLLFYAATGLAFAAALLNVAFDFCLGCELYLLGARLFGGSLRGTGKAATR